MTKKSINGSANADFTYDILCDVEAALNAVRGKFYPDKDYGSKIRSICEMPRSFMRSAMQGRRFIIWTGFL